MPRRKAMDFRILSVGGKDLEFLEREALRVGDVHARRHLRRQMRWTLKDVGKFTPLQCRGSERSNKGILREEFHPINVVIESNMKVTLATSLTIAFCIFVLFLPAYSLTSARCKAWVVQSIPTDMPHLELIPGVLSTADVLRWLAGNSSNSLDIMAQYWQLVASPEDPCSGDYGYSKDEMSKLGVQEGFRVYKSISDAADRNVSIRLLQHTGVYPQYTEEPSALSSGRVNVKSVTVLLSKWWGSGILHAKVWISNSKDIYIGSANNDWKSLTQVKEVGIYLVDCLTIAKKAEIYYDNLWKLAFLNASANTMTIWDHQWQISRQVPCWSHFIESKTRCRSPLPSYVDVHHVTGYPRLSDPDMFKIPIVTPAFNYSVLEPQPSYLSFAPPELLFGKYQGDEQAWVDTIKSVTAEGTVRISTMDWLGQSQYINPAVYWSTLSSAISEVIISKSATIRILVAYWAHFINNTHDYLNSLLFSNTLCSSSKYNRCSGKVEIKYYIVPGFNLTGPAISRGVRTGNVYPGFSRVNHGKYVVSNARAHIGTSNLVWDYFYTTAGVGFGMHSSAIVEQLQRIFDADWNSPYAIEFDRFHDDGHCSSR